MFEYQSDFRDMIEDILIEFRDLGCDIYVIENGLPPTDYVQHLLKIRSAEWKSRESICVTIGLPYRRSSSNGLSINYKNEFKMDDLLTESLLSVIGMISQKYDDVYYTYTSGNTISHIRQFEVIDDNLIDSDGLSSDEWKIRYIAIYAMKNS